MPAANLQSYVQRRSAFSRGEDSPAGFLQRCLEIVDRREADVKAFVALDREGALAAAAASTERWRSGTPLSAIDGMPIGVKDVIETANLPTGQGAERFAGVHTGRDAAAVFALREAGAIILGKTVTTELAGAPPNVTRNPLDLDRTPGGSSSGSAAAVAAGMVPAALGTQVLASIMRPASYCGVYAYKPTFGALNRGGCNDQLSQSCLGVLGASLDDMRAVVEVIVDVVGGDPGYPGLDLSASADLSSNKTIAILEQPGFELADSEARAAFARLCDRLRAQGFILADRRSDAALDELEHALSPVLRETLRIINWESIWPMREYASASVPGLTSHTLARIAEGKNLTLADYRAALRQRDATRQLAERALARYDAAISLAATGPAPQGLASTGNPAQNVSTSYLGAPVFALPLMSAQDLPVGLQVMGRPGADAALWATASGLLQALI